MFRHVALFRLTSESTAEQRAALLDGLRTLPGKIPELRDYRVGADADLAEGNWDVAVVADFDDEAGYHVYASHPAHVEVATTLVRPILADRAAVQYPC